jgi:glycerol-3-phosphate dehydrogenase (NAD(P)+)
MKAAVIGSGSWGTAFAKVLGEAGSAVTMWARREAVAAEIRDKHGNDGSLPGVRLSENVTATTDLAEAVSGAELIAIAVPSQTLRGNLADWAGLFPADSTVVSLMKGIELGTLKRMSEVIVETARVAPERVVVVSGPNVAPEIAAEQPTTTVVACSDESRAKQVQHALATPYFRPYTSDDVIGCELGGACKNVIALGLAETARLGVALGADPLTFAGLAGLGDLVASCSSPLARNRMFGEHLGRGETLEQAQIATRQTAEGVKSCLSIRDLARANGVEMPIVEQVERVCHEGVDPRVAVKLLMTREMKPE